jgi:sugar (pentulose or hexulose) kinase
MNAARAAGALEHCALGLDLGTSSAKAVVTDIEGKVLAQASAGYAVTSAVSGYAESEPAHWWSAVTECAREAVRTAVRAAGTRPAAGRCVPTAASGRPRWPGWPTRWPPG